VDSVTLNDRGIMNMMAGRGDLQFNMGSEPWWRPGVLHFTKVFPLTEVLASVCKQKNLHIDLTKDRTQNPLKRSLESYPEISTSYNINKVTPRKMSTNFRKMLS
jgi:hypothetical protein